MRISTAFLQNTKAIFDSRVYPNYAPQNTPRPFCVYVTTNTTKENTVDDGFTGDSKVLLDAYIFADDSEKIQDLKDDVIAAMQAQTDLPSCSVLSDAYSFNEVVQAHVIVINFVMWEQLT